MDEKDKITQVIFSAIDEINETLSPQKRIVKLPQTPLVGSQSSIDSLALVLLVVAIERKYSNTFGKSISLSDQLMMSVEHNPFKTIATLQDYILKLATSNSNV